MRNERLQNNNLTEKETICQLRMCYELSRTKYHLKNGEAHKAKIIHSLRKIYIPVFPKIFCVLEWTISLFTYV